MTAWNIPHLYGVRAWLPPSSSDEAALEAQARRELTQAVEEVLGPSPQSARVRIEARYGTAAGVLIDASRDASVLVVGSRGLGGFSGLLLGSVASTASSTPPARSSWSGAARSNPPGVTGTHHCPARRVAVRRHPREPGRTETRRIPALRK
ncbi:universal stress protein [Streptomyces sp. NPDC057616]|uniref:universal stress protein n=1 Tax=Streptomyces sp. NPDC057616 TaxID=3346183 RepID=UPI00368472D3